MYDNNDGMMRIPSPDHTDSGYTAHRNPGYAAGMAPDEAPPGTVWSPELGTYVDEDVMASLLSAEPGPVERPEHDGLFTHDAQFDQPEMTDNELAELQAQIDADTKEGEGTNNTTLNALTDEYGSEVVDDALSILVESAVTETTEETLSSLADALGTDSATVSSMIYSAVAEASPSAVESVGAGCWNSLLTAAQLGGDREARAIIAGYTTGHIPASSLPGLYRDWYYGLPDAEG